MLFLIGPRLLNSEGNVCFTRCCYVMSNLRVGGMPSSELGTSHSKAQLGH